MIRGAWQATAHGVAQALLTVRSKSGFPTLDAVRAPSLWKINLFLIESLFKFKFTLKEKF